MKKKGLLLVVALLALSGLMAAMAYSNAHVSNATLSAIVQTDNAWLAVVPNPDFDDFAKVNDRGVMVIDFTGPNARGFQPNSVYEFKNLFYLKNNLDEPVEVGLRFANCYKGESARWIKGLRTITTTGGQKLITADSGHTFSQGIHEGLKVTIPAGGTIPLHWEFNVHGESSLGSGSYTLEVKSDVIGR